MSSLASRFEQLASTSAAPSNVPSSTHAWTRLALSSSAAVDGPSGHEQNGDERNALQAMQMLSPRLGSNETVYPVRLAVSGPSSPSSSDSGLQPPLDEHFDASILYSSPPYTLQRMHRNPWPPLTSRASQPLSPIQSAGSLYQDVTIPFGENAVPTLSLSVANLAARFGPTRSATPSTSSERTAPRPPQEQRSPQASSSRIKRSLSDYSQAPHRMPASAPASRPASPDATARTERSASSILHPSSSNNIAEGSTNPVHQSIRIMISSTDLASAITKTGQLTPALPPRTQHSKTDSPLLVPGPSFPSPMTTPPLPSRSAPLMVPHPPDLPMRPIRVQTESPTDTLLARPPPPPPPPSESPIDRNTLPASTSEAPPLLTSPTVPDRPRAATLHNPMPMMHAQRLLRSPELQESVSNLARRPLSMVAEPSYLPPPPPVRKTTMDGSFLRIGSPAARLGSASPIVPPSAEDNLPHVDKGGTCGTSPESDEASEDGANEPDTKQVLEMPDATFASRQPPKISPERTVSIGSPVSAVDVCGRYAVTATSLIRIWDTWTGEVIRTILLPGENTITAVKFIYPDGNAGKDPVVIWAGTKNGHLFEVDLGSHSLVKPKTSAHSHAISGIFRVPGNFVVTICEFGKVQIWSNSINLGLTPSLSSQPSTQRLSSKQSFVQIIGKQLWSSHGPQRYPAHASNMASKAAYRSPAIRVYDLASDTNFSITRRPVYLPESAGSVGRVTACTTIPRQSKEIYLAHDTGHISVWDSTSLTCLFVLRISSYAITALEGVLDYLWAGNREGKVYVYDVRQSPWKVIKVWKAADEPIVGLRTDLTSVATVSHHPALSARSSTDVMMARIAQQVTCRKLWP